MGIDFSFEQSVNSADRELDNANTCRPALADRDCADFLESFPLTFPPFPPFPPLLGMIFIYFCLGFCNKGYVTNSVRYLNNFIDYSVIVYL